MRSLYLDCAAGISGDMAVGALLDLGVSFDALAGEIAKLGLTNEYHLHRHRSARQYISGTKFDVHTDHSHHEHHHHDDHEHHEHTHDHGHAHPGWDAAHPHSHSHGHHSHADDAHAEKEVAPHVHGRSFRQIAEIIEQSSLDSEIKERSIATFRRIAIAEGKIHAMPPEDVTFHEVGAIDSIVDIVGFCAGIRLLDVRRVFASRLVEGTGSINCAHGRYPLPAPATAEILAGIPLAQIDSPHEMITPTGAAILAEFAESHGPMPEIRIERIGYGLGSRDTAPRPNVLRAILGDLVASEPVGDSSDIVTQIETNLDDCTGEIVGATIARLLASGALDVFVTPVHMKKNRPGIILTVLAEPQSASALAELILRETTAFGIRLHDVRRLKLRREIQTVQTAYGSIAVKFGYLDNNLCQIAPEFESCRAAAESSNASLQDIFHAARSAARDALPTSA